MTPSPYQQAIYDRVVNEPTRSMVVIAVAGSGKTTTGVHCCHLIQATQRTAFVAFNKPVAMELQAKVPRHVQAQTVHSMSFRALRNYWGSSRINLEDNKTRAILFERMNKETYKAYGSGVEDLVSLAKAHGLLPKGVKGTGLMMDTEQNWADLMEKFGVEFEGEDAKPEVGIEFARKCLIESIEEADERRWIDFDDQLYLPMIWQAKFEQYDNLLVDEAQDINPVQRANLKMSLKIGGRLIAFGDPCQSIYAFRGADTESIEKIKQEFNAVEMPLTISYRCPKVVVAEAKKFVPYIEAADTAPDGKFEVLNEFYPSTFRATDAVVCRLNAPLIDLAYKLLRQGVACKVLGRKIGEGLLTLIKKMNASGVDELEERLDQYADREIQKLIAKGKEDKAANIEDKIDTIRIFINRLSEDRRTVAALISEIEAMFADKNVGRLTLCSSHRSKGLEWDRVFVLNRSLMPLKWARQAWEQEQEHHIIYVSVTRARQELYYMELDGWCENEPKERKDQ